MKPLATLAEIREASETIGLQELGLDIDELRPLKLGRADGPRVTVFVDPHCPHCERLLQSAQSLLGRYHFAILPIGILGPDSATDARRLGCAVDRQAAAEALLSRDFGDLVQIADCDLEPLRKTLVTAQMFGVEGVPFLIAPDGAVLRGVPADLAQWLAGHGG
jgi:thiol:disulfide interchange protein DsbC